MIKKRFKQYTILKHKKRMQSFEFAFTKQGSATDFYAPNRITKTLFKGFPIYLSGYNFYKKFEHEPAAYSFIKQKNVIFPGSWLGTLEKISKKTLGLSNIFPHTILVRVLFVLQARLLTILNANIL